MYELNSINYEQLISLPEGVNIDYLVLQAVYPDILAFGDKHATFNMLYDKGRFRFSISNEMAQQAMDDFLRVNPEHVKGYSNAVYHYTQFDPDNLLTSVGYIVTMAPIDKCRCILLVATGMYV
jgi:hypothetical protein